jgi:phosphatidylinositol alpha-1,6-mannosyltransferase
VRLLYVSHSFPPRGRPLANIGGMQRVATELYAALEAHPDVELDALVLRASWRATHVRVVPFGLSLIHRIPRLVEEHRVEAVLFSSMVTAAFALPVLGRLRRRGVITAAIPVGRDVTLPVAPYQRLVPRVLGALDLVLPISRATAAECEHRGAPTESIRIVPCGVSPERFAPLTERMHMRGELLSALGLGADALPPGALLLCGVGRHIERKGFAWFVDRVLPLLPPEVHFCLAGEGPETPSVREAVMRRGLEGRVRLLGRVSDALLARLYRGSDLYAMPNLPVPGDIEGFGVVMLEAGLCGLPTIGARLEGIRDAIREGENGTLVPSGDERAFAAAILRFHRDRAALAAASERAARYTEATFAWPAVADQYVRTLRAATGRPARRAAAAHLPLSLRKAG